MKIAVVILNWNGRKMLEKFLPSVVQHSSQDAEVIIADNGSTDDSLAFLAQNYPNLRTIIMDKNYGFAEGYNKALAQIEADYYILLNDDVEVCENWIMPVINQMESNPRIGICQPKMMMYDRQDHFEYAGAAGGFIDILGYPFCRGRIFNTIEYDLGQYNDACDCFWASGAAMFVKAQVWKELQGLDGDFFAHMEEIDFCWRAQNQGWKVQYCPQSEVYHVGGGTLPKSSPHKTYLNFRNNLSMLYKNLPQKQLCTIIAIRHILDMVAAITFLIQGKPKEFTAVFQAHKDYRKAKPILKQKRKQLSHSKIQTIYPKSILIDYHLRKKSKYSQLMK